jgi:hypothetical protein
LCGYVDSERPPAAGVEGRKPDGLGDDYDADYVALTTLQADAFITSARELARAISGLVETAPIEALRSA